MINDQWIDKTNDKHRAMNRKKYYPWLVVALLWVVALLNYLDRQMLATMKPAMQVDITELKLATNFGHLMAVFLWIYGMMSPLAGMIADKTNRKWLIVGSLFVWSGVTFGMGYASTYHQLYVLRAIMGVSEALYIPAGLSLIADYHQKRTRSLAVGLHMTGLYFGQALGGFGATIASNTSWQATFHTFGYIGMAYALVLVWLLKEYRPTATTPPSVTRTPFSGLSVLLRNGSFWMILLYFAIPSLPGWATKNWLPTLFSNNLNIPMAAAGPLSTITIAGSSFVGVIFGGMLSDAWVNKHIKGRIYCSAIGLGLTVPALLLLGFGNSLLFVLLAALGFGLGFGMFDANNMPILCQFVDTKHRATAYGLMNMVGVFSGAFITDLLGRFVDSGHLGRAFAVLAFIVLAVVLLQLSLLKPTTNDFQEE
ncbi:MFS transporter [Olivibacter jilunii]